jgi:hypothetical protein
MFRESLTVNVSTSVNMETFEAFLDNATVKAANIIPGAVMAVVDQHGIHLHLKIAVLITDARRKLRLQEGFGY